MPSEIAQKAAGTYIKPETPKLSSTPMWAMQECRRGVLKPHVEKFCAAQLEILNPELLKVESVMPDRIVCSIPCRVADHESPTAILTEVRFALNPLTGECVRFD
jgi:hypothetical protein